MQICPSALARRMSMPSGARLWPVLVACAVGMASFHTGVWGEEPRKSSQPATASQAQLLVENTTSRVIAAMSRDSGAMQAESTLASEVVETIVMPNVDLKRISRLVLGEHWLNASKNQRERFMRAFGAQLVHTYVIAVSDYLSMSDKIGLEIDYLPAKTNKDGTKVLVRSRVGKSSARVSIDYRLHRVEDEWKVYDVLVDGVSVVLTYRKSYAAAAVKGGLDHLIERITAKNRKLRPA
jgi:phospholipid transport system substrate-binding protein